MDKYELAKNLGIDLEELEELGREFRETIDKIDNSISLQEEFNEWLDNKLNSKSFTRKGCLNLISNMDELPYMKYITDRVGTMDERAANVDKSKKEYRGAFSATPFKYMGRNYIMLAKYSGEVWLYDVERYGKFLGMGKEKFTNVKYYAEIGEK
ncbi:hypothetical protein NHG34_03645 [Aerococcaceae bacterium NML190938]|nr:hypothetical protein [Aerococcaceae bacterium NML190938]